MPGPEHVSAPGSAPSSAERSWGSWHVLDTGSGYNVRRIEVRPGHRLSLQTHDHRSEQWLVVAGRATCSIDGETVTVEPGEHVDIPGAHRLGNEGEVPLGVIEVQRGAYTGEEDISRLEDDYDRSEVR